MRFYRRVPSGDLRLDEFLVRCSVCGTLNDVRTTPSGGRYAPVFTDSGQDNFAGGPIYTTTAAGCSHCGSPAWRTGGKGGDIVGG